MDTGETGTIHHTGRFEDHNLAGCRANLQLNFIIGRRSGYSQYASREAGRGQKAIGHSRKRKHKQYEGKQLSFHLVILRKSNGFISFLTMRKST